MLFEDRPSPSKHEKWPGEVLKQIAEIYQNRLECGDSKISLLG
jgi:hypothetical protein